MPVSRLFQRALAIATACLFAVGAASAADHSKSRAEKRAEKQRTALANKQLEKQIERYREEMEHEAKDDPAAAEKFFLKKRLAPGMTHFPVERLTNARAHARAMRLHSTQTQSYITAPEGSLAASSTAWTPLGPGNVGGRTRVLKFAPGSTTTMYAAGVAGGVWKSTDAGTTWTALGDAMANMAVNSLAIDPVNTQVIYAGTGEGYFNIDAERGAGIFKSTDGGVNWVQLTSTVPPGSLNFTRVNDLALSPTNSSIVFAATRTGLWRSTDAGSTWSQMIDANTARGCMKVVLRTDADTAIASCGTFAPNDAANGIWRSTNASAATPTWTHVLGGTGSGATQILTRMSRISLAIAPSQQSTIYALISCSYTSGTDCGSGNFDEGLLAVYRSTDGGATWSSRYTSTFNTNTHNPTLGDLILTNPNAFACSNALGYNQGWYDNSIGVNPVNPNQIFAAGIDWFRSDDGGATWGLASYWWIDPTNATYGNKYAHADNHTITFHPSFNGTTEQRVYIGDDGGMFVSSNATSAALGTDACPKTVSALGGVTWATLNNGYGVTQYYHGTAYPTGTRYFGGAQDNGTTRGADGSPNAWVEITGGDGGWTAIDKNTSGATTVLYSEYTGISIQKSSDDGATFANAITGISNTGCGQFINPFQMDPNNTQRLFTSNNQLWRTSNAAGSWSAASAALTGTSCTVPASDSGERFTNYAIAPGNSDLLIAGTDNGQLCRLTNATTSTSATALSNCTQPAGAGAYIAGVSFDPNNGAKAYAAVSTFGVGHVWKSTNSGQTWTNIDGSGVSALPDVPAHTVAVSPLDLTGNTIYVGTDVGVFITTDGGATWARENTGFANVITDHLVFNTNASSVTELFAFTHGRGAWKTTASGTSGTTTTTVLTSSVNPTVFGQSTTLTATVTGGATPTGTVTFKDGATIIGTGTLNASGIATLAISTLSVGTHNIEAKYGGDGTHGTSSSNPLSQVVNKASTTLSITDLPDPSAVGQSVTITKTLLVTSPGSGTPTGTITVTGTATTGCTITLPATTCSLTFTAGGAQTLAATYSGDSSFSGSSVSGVAHTVTGSSAASTTVLTSSPDPSTLGQSVTLTATVSGASGTPTGTVTFLDGATTLGTGTLNGSGVATFSTAAFTVGTHNLTANYGGDSTYGTSSGVDTQTVNKATSTTVLTSSPDPSTLGQSVTLTATVTGSQGTATGTVTFLDGATTLGTGTLNASGVATFSTSAFTLGTHNLTANYGGDSTYATSSGTDTQTVNKATSTTTLTSAPDPSTLGQSVTLTATVTGSQGTATGTVTFLDGATTLGTGTLNGSGVATFSTSAFTLGTHNLTANYGGDSTYATSSGTDTQTVNKATSTTVLTSSPDPSTVGQSVTLTATVTGSQGTATGTVTFLDGATTLGTGTLNGSGVATFSTSAFTAGTHNLTANYGGDSTYATSSGTDTQTVKATSTTVLTSSPDPSTLGQSVTLTATVSGASGTPTGTVTFLDGATTLGTGTLNGSGVATFSTTAFTLGTHNLTANYGGDSTYATSSGADTQTVKAASTTALTSAPDPSTLGQSVTLTATVSGASGTPTGTVTFLDGATTLGTGTLNGSGVATFSTAAFTVGSHNLTANYGGDSTYATSSGTDTQTVNKATSTTVLTSAPDPSTLGQSVTLTATVTGSQGTATGTVTFLDGATTLGTGTLNGSGVATFSTTSFTLGTHNLTANYGGDSTYATSSGTDTQTVNKATSTTTLTSSPDPSTLGQSVTLTATVTGSQGTATGTVTFLDGATTLGTGTLNGSGVATFSTSAFTLGTHNLTANYGGDSTYATSSGTDTQTVNKATSTTVLTSSPDPSTLGQSVTLTATVTGSQGTATGTVTFLDGATTLGTGTLNASGVATFSTSAFTVGTHNLTANYGGDSTYATSSGTDTQTVNKAASTTVLTSSPDPSTLGQSVTLTATVTGSQGTATGTVTFLDGATTLGTGTLNGSGVATFSTSAFTLGTHNLTANYGGDSTYATSSGADTQTVNKATSATTLTSSPDPSTLGQSVTLTATVTGSQGTATGTVTFLDGATTLGTGTLNASGVATFSTTSFTLGTHNLTANYGGDSTYATSSGTDTQTVNKATSTTTLTSSPDPSTFGQTVTLTATVTGSQGTATGTVTFTEGATTLGTGTLNAAGVATLSISSLSIGAHNLTATYAGNATYNGSAGNDTQDVGKATSTTVLTTSPDPSTFGQSVTLTATVSGTQGAPTGTVTFSEGATTLGTGTINGAGVATFSTSSLTIGSHTLTATYAGDSVYASSSDTDAQLVAKAVSATALTSSPDPSTFGQSVTLTATVTGSQGTPTGNVTFYDGATVIGPATLNASGVATLTTTSLGVGGHALSADYGGDSTYAASTGADAHTVDKAASGTTLASSPDPSAFGQSVTLTATVGGAQGTPTGTVTFFDGATSLGSSAVNGSGVATLSTSALAIGAHSLSAVYGGNAVYAGSTGVDAHTVSLTADLSITLDDHRASIVTGTTATYDVIVANAGPSTATGATVTVTPSANLATVTWTCTATPQSLCPSASGSGALNETITLPSGQSLHYVVTGTVTGAVGATLTQTASVAAPSGTADTNTANDDASDGDAIVADGLFQDGFE